MVVLPAAEFEVTAFRNQVVVRLSKSRNVASPFFAPSDSQMYRMCTFITSDVRHHPE